MAGVRKLTHPSGKAEKVLSFACDTLMCGQEIICAVCQAKQKHLWVIKRTGGIYRCETICPAQNENSDCVRSQCFREIWRINADSHACPLAVGSVSCEEGVYRRDL